MENDSRFQFIENVFYIHMRVVITVILLKANIN